MRAFTFLLVVLASLHLSAQDLLEYNLQVNDKFNIEQHAQQHIIQDINGVDQIINNHLKSAMLFKVVKVTKDLITFEMTFQHLKMTMSSPSLGELLHADTKSEKKNDPTSLMFKGILNIPVTLEMRKTGKIESVSGGDQLIASMFKIADITDPATIAANTAQFEKQFGSAALSNSFEQMTYFLPAKMVKVNDHWENVYQGDLTAINTWTLNSRTSESINITGKAEVTMSTMDDNVTMALSGTQKTSIISSPNTGMFKEIIVEGTYEGDAQVHANNLTIPTKIQSTINYKILN